MSKLLVLKFIPFNEDPKSVLAFKILFCNDEKFWIWDKVSIRNKLTYDKNILQVV